MAKILLQSYHSSSDDKGNLISGEEQDAEQLNNLINEALSYGYYIQIIPSRALVDEKRENGDILFMYSNRRLVQR